MSDFKPPPTTYIEKPDRDRWTEHLRCRHCNSTGTTTFSAADKWSWDVQVESISEGFKAIAVACGSEFFCAVCDNMAEM